MSDENELSEAELQQLKQEEQLKKDINYLMSDATFQRVILQGYIAKTALAIGSNFTGSDDQQRALSAVSYLQAFLTNNK